MKATDHKLLEAMIDQMNASTARADAALDEALAFVAESEKRIEAMDAVQELHLKVLARRRERAQAVEVDIDNV